MKRTVVREAEPSGPRRVPALGGPTKRTIALLIAGGAVFFSWLDYHPVSIYFENRTIGQVDFYMNGKLVCEAPPNQFCTQTVNHWLFPRYHVSARTYYPDRIDTPTASLPFPSPGTRAYRFLACGVLGQPGSNCGLFTMEDRHPLTHPEPIPQ